MDITLATTLATAIVGLVTPIIIQVSKQYIPTGWTEVYALAVSILLGALAIAATNGFHGYAWGVTLTAVVGVSQAVYAIVNKATAGSISKDAKTS